MAQVVPMALPEDDANADAQKLLADYLRQQQMQQKSLSLGQRAIQDGTSTKPVASHAQGLARMLQAGLGGFFEHLDDEKASKAIAAQRAELNDADNDFSSSLLGGAGDAPATPGPQAGGAGGLNDVAGKVYATLLQEGIPPTVAAGMVGNAGAESSFNPTAIGDGGTSFGLWQHRKDRRDGLNRFAQEIGGDINDPTVQARWAARELKTTENRAFKLASQAKTPEEASAIIAQHYERPAAWALQKSLPHRQRLAAQAFQRFGQQPGRTQVASLDPSVGIQQQQPATAPQMPAGGQQPQPGAPMPPQAQAAPQPQPAPQQVAQAQTGRPSQQQAQQALRYLQRTGGKGPLAGQAKQILEAYQKGPDYQYNVNEKTGEVMRIEKGAGRIETLRPGQQPGPDHKEAADLRKEVQNLPSFKSYTSARPAYESMVDAAKRDNKAADLNMVYAFAKIADPGSVVREGEIVMVNDTQGLADRLNGFIRSIQGEGRLSPQARKMLLQEAESRIKSFKQQYDTDVRAYEGIVSRRGLNRDDVILGYGDLPQIPEIGAPPPPGAPGAPGATAPAPQIRKGSRATNDQTGETIEWDGQKWVPVK